MSGVETMSHDDNHSDDDNDILRKKISFGFDSLRNLKENIQPILENRLKERQLHVNREGILFRVGQVVKHKSQKWRGVVFSWKHISDVANDVDIPLSENQKQHANDLGALYSVLVDSTDLGRLQQYDDSISTENHIQHIPQCDLEEVSTDHLIRIRNPFLSTKFDRLDHISNQSLYAAKPSLAYEFPVDEQPSTKTTIAYVNGELISDFPKEQIDILKCYKQINKGIESFTYHLRDVIHSNSVDEIESITTSPSSFSSPVLVDTLIDQLDSILLLCEQSNEIVTTPPSLSSLSQLKNNSANVVSSFNIFVGNVLNIMSLRRKSIDYFPQLKYRLGDIVKKNSNGCRCVVVGYTFPISNTEKYHNTERGNKSTLYYHLKPDMNDMSKIFHIGETTTNSFGFDKVFHANEYELSACTLEECRNGLEVGLIDDDWKFENTIEECKYIPPDELKFQYGLALKDSDVTTNLLDTLMKEILLIQHSIQARTISSNVDNSRIQDIANLLSLDNLFVMLRNSDTSDHSKVTEEFIHDIFNAHPDTTARERFAQGSQHLLHGDSKESLEIFHALLIEHPNYFECWNKIATSYFLIGSMDDSLYATEQVLSFEPRHYAAMAGLGLIKQKEGDIVGAAQAFSDCLDYSPWSMVSSSLSACLDQIGSGGPECDNNL